MQADDTNLISKNVDFSTQENAETVPENKDEKWYSNNLLTFNCDEIQN